MLIQNIPNFVTLNRLDIVLEVTTKNSSHLHLSNYLQLLAWGRSYDAISQLWRHMSRTRRSLLRWSQGKLLQYTHLYIYII